MNSLSLIGFFHREKLPSSWTQELIALLVLATKQVNIRRFLYSDAADPMWPCARCCRPYQRRAWICMELLCSSRWSAWNQEKYCVVGS